MEKYIYASQRQSYFEEAKREASEDCSITGIKNENSSTIALSSYKVKLTQQIDNQIRERYWEPGNIYEESSVTHEILENYLDLS